MRIFTSGFRLVRTVSDKGTDAQAAIAASRFSCDSAVLKGLSNGVYYYQLIITKAGATAISRVDKFIILK